MKRWIQTFDPGPVDGAFDYEHPELFTWPVPFIAHHTANINRYTGAARRTYSVAEHSWRVALYAADLVKAFEPDKSKHPELCLKASRKGLMHDAHESAVGDVNSPLKSMPFMAGYKAYEKSLIPMVNARFALEDVFVTHEGRAYNVVVCADLAALAFERVQLLGKAPHAWDSYDILPVVDSKAFMGDLGMPAEEAEKLFLDGCKVLGLK